MDTRTLIASFVEAAAQRRVDAGRALIRHVNHVQRNEWSRLPDGYHTEFNRLQVHCDRTKRRHRYWVQIQRRGAKRFELALA